METQDKKKILIEKTTELVNDATNYMLGQIERVCNCGAIDIDSYEGNLMLPRKIVAALCRQAEHTYFIPRNKADKDDVDNIFACI
jgi:hypothetical protein